MDKLYKLEKKTIIEGFPPFLKKKRKEKSMSMAMTSL